MVKSGGLLFHLPDIFNLLTQGLILLVRLAAKESKTSNKDIFVDAGLNVIGKKIKNGISSITGSGITLTNNEIKDIIKVIKFLENIGIYLKGTTTKITSQERRFLNFLRPPMTAGLPLIKNV